MERVNLVLPSGTKARIHHWICENGYYDCDRIGEFIRDAIEEKLKTEL